MSAQEPKRSYGTGSLYVHTDSAGREFYYGRWRNGGRQLNRCLGPKRNGKLGLTLPQAEAELRRLIAEVKLTRKVGGEALTIAELGRRYLVELDRQGRKKATVVAVKSILRIWLEPFFGERNVARITAEGVHDLILLMEQGERPGPRQKGDRRYGKPVGAKSIRNYIGTLSALLGFAERKGWLATNVARRIDLPAAPRSEDIHFLDVDEVNALVAMTQPGAYESIDRALYLTAAMTGLRQGELVALRWRDVDWPAARVRVRQSYVLEEFGTPKSKRSTRSVPMADAVGGALERLFKASSCQGDEDLVFADPLTGAPLSKAAILRRYRKALKAAKLDETHRFHDLRHTFGTRMAAAGVSMRTLQEWMGHRDIETTQRYADYAPSPHEAAFVEAAFGAAPAPVAALR
jgi:integrase